LKKLMIIYKK